MPGEYIEVAPSNSVILVGDSASVEIPESIGEPPVSATKSSLAIGTLAEMDGKTRILLIRSSDFRPEDTALQLAWRGDLETASNTVTVEDILGNVLMQLPVGNRCNIGVYVNDNSEPNDIAIVVDSDISLN